MSKILTTTLIVLLIVSCSQKQEMDVTVFETSASGNQLTEVSEFEVSNPEIQVTLNPSETYQEVTGFGGSFTESTAYLLNQLGEENRKKIIDAYFGDEGAKYSLTRTHINSCDFSLTQYSYAEVPDDMELENFSIEHDRNDIYIDPPIEIHDYSQVKPLQTRCLPCYSHQREIKNQNCLVHM